MIEVRNMSKSIEGNLILDNICMDVKKGSIYGLVGPNGAGKTTLLRTVVGVYRPDAGGVFLEETPVYENILAKRQIAFIPDDIYVRLMDTPMSLAKLYKGIYPDFDMEYFESLFEFFPAIGKKKYIRTFSKGMRRQCAFMLALSINPKVIILDEPLDGLDPLMRRQILKTLVSRVGEKELTVIISSHNLRELEDVCDCVGIMDRGRLVIEKPLENLQASIVKAQVAFDRDFSGFPEDMDILHKISMGRVHTLIIRGTQEEIREKISPMKPVILDILPLTLEEIFIYEMGGMEDGTYNTKDMDYAGM